MSQAGERPSKVGQQPKKGEEGSKNHPFCHECIGALPPPPMIRWFGRGDDDFSSEGETRQHLQKGEECFRQRPKKCEEGSAGQAGELPSRAPKPLRQLAAKTPTSR